MKTPCMFFNFAVVRQHFSTRAEDEDVILGNDVLIRCRVPSFVGDFLDVVGWINSEGENFVPGSQNNGKFGSLSTLVCKDSDNCSRCSFLNISVLSGFIYWIYWI